MHGLRRKPWQATITSLLAGSLAALVLARGFPEFCARHALMLSAAGCCALGAIALLRRQLENRKLVCDGRWLAYRCWQLGLLFDLRDLAAIRAHAGSLPGTIAGITLCSSRGALLRLGFKHWHSQDVRALIEALLNINPQLSLDGPTRLWMQQPSPERSARLSASR